MPDPFPEFLLMYVVCLSAVYLTPQWTPLSISLICFVLTPFVMAARPRGFVRFLCRVVQLSLLFPWLWWLWDFWQGLHRPPASRGYWMWGFYAWASSFTLAWLATIVQPVPPGKPRLDRRHGFPVVPLVRDDNSTTESRP